MTTLLSAIGRTFLRTFGAALLVYALGVLAAPDLATARSLGVAALLSSVAAGIRAIQMYVPQITISHWLEQPYGAWADAFVHGFLASLLVTVLGVLSAPDLHTARALAVAGIVGAVTAGVRALQGVFTTNEHPVPKVGVPEPTGASSRRRR